MTENDYNDHVETLFIECDNSAQNLIELDDSLQEIHYTLTQLIGNTDDDAWKTELETLRSDTLYGQELLSKIRQWFFGLEEVSKTALMKWRPGNE